MSFTSTGGPFGAIRPDETDYFTFNFAKKIGTTGTITAAVWSCVVASGSPVPDPNAAACILTSQYNPTFDPAAKTTTALCGNFLDGAWYTLQAAITLDDLRQLTLLGDIQATFGTSPADQVLSVELFRDHQPTFSDANRFPDEEVQFWINQALSPPNISSALNPYRWGQFYNLGVELWVAHNLAIMDAQNTRMNGPGGSMPGSGGSLLGSGMYSSKSVNGVSLALENNFGQANNAGWWGLTLWGNQFLYYLRLAGAAPVHLLGVDYFAPAYGGPYVGPPGDYFGPYYRR